MKRLLYFANKWPAKHNSGNDNLFFSLISSFANADYNTTVVSNNPADPQKTNDLTQHSIEIVSYKPQKGLKVGSFNFQIAIFDSMKSSQQFSFEIYNKYNKIPQIYLLGKLNQLVQYSKRQSQTTTDLIKKGTKMWPNSIQSEQYNAIIRSDITIVNSNFTLYKLKQRFDNLIYGNELLPTDQFEQQIKSLNIRPFKRRQNFYFIGNLSQSHNFDCVIRLLSIWESLHRQFPNEQLHIISSVFPQEIYKRKTDLRKMNIVLKQEIEDYQQLSKYRMLLAPFRYHVGTPSKITQAWFYHTPVVTTPYGSQSLFLELSDMTLTKIGGRFLGQKVPLTDDQKTMQNEIKKYYDTNTIGQDNFNLNFGGLWKNYTDDQFISSVIQLSKDQKLWKKCREMGEKIILANHSDEIYFRRIQGAIATAEYKRMVSPHQKLKKDAWESYIIQSSKKQRQIKKNISSKKAK